MNNFVAYAVLEKLTLTVNIAGDIYFHFASKNLEGLLSWWAIISCFSIALLKRFVNRVIVK